MRIARHFVLAAAALAAGCATPDKPVRPLLYDFGPAAAAPATAPSLAPLLLAEVEAAPSFEGQALVYRLGHADPRQLRAYANARWGAPPAQLVRQRLREVLGRDRLVLDAEAAAALVRTGGMRPRVLRVELEEFSHYFESELRSHAMLRLRCTLLDNTAGGERVVAQRTLALQSPAPSADAAGGVSALAAATDAAAAQLAGWLAERR